MCSFICSTLQRLKNFFVRLIRNIGSLIAYEATRKKRRVSPTLIFNKDKIIGNGMHRFVFEGTLKVAVKRIETVRIENNAREVHALRKCHHPNVIKLLDVQSDDNFEYYVLEFCVASLDRLFLGETDPKKYTGHMPATKKEVCLQLAKGMAHIHEKGLIHRDVKPGNVLIWVDSTGERVLMKWADFGLSKPVNERGSHSVSGLRGTENWYAPEIYRIQSEEEENVENPIRPRGTVKSDVFSEGLVFGYYLLGGKHPYGETFDIRDNVLQENRVNLNGKEHLAMYNIIMGMLNNDPVERISSSQVVERISNIE